MGGKRWSKEEIALLEKNYPLLGGIAMTDLLPNRTYEAIRKRAEYLKVKAPTGIWSSTEITILKEQYPILGPTELFKLSILPGKTAQSIKDKASKLGLKAPSTLLPEEFVDKVLQEAGLERLSKYKGHAKLLKLRHTYCGYIWAPKYNDIQQGTGCPRCNIGFGWTQIDRPEKAWIYLFLIETETETFYKIGITCRPIKRRQSDLKADIKNLKSIKLIHLVEGLGIEVKHREFDILAQFSHYKSEQRFNGYTELLDINNNLEQVKSMMETKNGRNNRS